jgi:amino acid transporter
MILVLFAYGGWNEMAYVGAEVRDPKRNVLRSLLLGTGIVAALYLAANLAFVAALGFDGLRLTKAAATDAVRPLWPDWGPPLVGALICVSALGSVNGQVFTGARIFYAVGREHRIYRPLGRWNATVDAPVLALLVQAAVTLALIWRLGPDERSFLRLVYFCAPPVWLFMLGTGLSLFVLRWREPEVERPFRVPLYPLTPLVYCAACLGMLVASVIFVRDELPPAVLWSLAAVMAAGLVLGLLERRQ